MMKSDVWQNFDNQVAASQWEEAIKSLNGLAMFEMLPALAALKPAVRKTVLEKAKEILTRWGWQGSSERMPNCQPNCPSRSVGSPRRRWRRSSPNSRSRWRATALWTTRPRAA